jgi:hypothetical protein
VDNASANDTNAEPFATVPLRGGRLVAEYYYGERGEAGPGDPRARRRLVSAHRCRVRFDSPPRPRGPPRRPAEAHSGPSLTSSPLPTGTARKVTNVDTTDITEADEQHERPIHDF